MICPYCGAEDNYRKNGSVHNGKAKLQCNACTRQFVQEYTRKIISGDVKNIVKRLFLLKTPMPTIVEITGISKSWLQKYKREIKKENQCSTSKM
jgi:transposase-like protein